jgi:hypothetical protein
MPTKPRKTLDAKLPQVRLPQPVRDVLEAEAGSRTFYCSLGAIIKEAIGEYIVNHQLFAKHGIANPADVSNQ